jgi:hypothetical protein
VVESYKLRFVRFEAIQKRGDLFSVIRWMWSRNRRRGWSVVGKRRPKGLELANKVPHGDAACDDGQIAREARPPSERTEDGGIVPQAFENDIRDDVFALGIRHCGASPFGGSCRDVCEESAETLQKGPPAFGVARDAAIQKALIRGCDKGRDRLSSHGIESGETEKRSPNSSIIGACEKAHHAESERTHETNLSCRFQNR